MNQNTVNESNLGFPNIIDLCHIHLTTAEYYYDFKGFFFEFAVWIVVNSRLTNAGQKKYCI